LRAILHHVAALFGSFANLLAGFFTGFRCVENSQCCSDAQSGQEPKDSAAIIISHKCLLQESSRDRMLALALWNYKPVIPYFRSQNY
jgi:hypothetical protein